MTLDNKSESRKNSIIVKKLFNKTVIDFNFSRNEDLSTLKSDVYISLATSVNTFFSGR